MLRCAITGWGARSALHMGYTLRCSPRLARNGFMRPFNTTTSKHTTLTEVSLRTYTRLHGDALVPRSFVVPDDPEWQPECHGHELGRHLHSSSPALRSYCLATYNTSTHMWTDVVKPRLQRYFEQRQAEAKQNNPDYADELFEFGLGGLISERWPFTDVEVVEVAQLSSQLQDIIYRGHFVSGYPERVEWLMERGVDVSSCMPEELPGAWDHTACPWGWCQGDESEHYMRCLESKSYAGTSSLHAQPYYTQEDKEQMFEQLQKRYNKLNHLNQDGRINADQVEQLVPQLAEIADAYGVPWWDHSSQELFIEVLETEYANHPSLEEIWKEFSESADLEMSENPWGEAGGRYRDERGVIISSPMWEEEKAYRTSAEGLASLRFSCHDTPGYERDGEWVSLQ